MKKKQEVNNQDECVTSPFAEGDVVHTEKGLGCIMFLNGSEAWVSFSNGLIEILSTYNLTKEQKEHE